MRVHRKPRSCDPDGCLPTTRKSESKTQMLTLTELDKSVIERFREKYKYQDAIFGLWDHLIHPVRRRNSDPRLIDKHSVKKLLLVNAGHIGDVVISTALLPVLREAIPDAKIGFLTGEYSRQVLDGHPHVSKVHCLNHWYLSRGGTNRLDVYRRFRHEKRIVVQEIKSEKYDLAIDLRAWFPNFIPILREAGIPIRIGFDRVGNGSLLTHRFKYQYDRRHELQHQLELLEPLDLETSLTEKAAPWLPLNGGASLTQNESVLLPDSFCILHPGSSTPARDWPQQNWITLAQRISASGSTPVLTGRGIRDAALADEISLAVPTAINLCNKLSWEDLLGVVSRADLVYSVETSVGHIAAALGRPVVSISGGMADSRQWAPVGAQVVTNWVPCSPCFEKKGCSHRRCLIDVSVEEVVEASGKATGSR